MDTISHLAETRLIINKILSSNEKRDVPSHTNMNVEGHPPVSPGVKLAIQLRGRLLLWATLLLWVTLSLALNLTEKLMGFV